VATDVLGSVPVLGKLAQRPVIPSPTSPAIWQIKRSTL